MLYDVLQESKAYQRIKQEGELQALHRTVSCYNEIYDRNTNNINQCQIQK